MKRYRLNEAAWYRHVEKLRKGQNSGKNTGDRGMDKIKTLNTRNKKKNGKSNRNKLYFVVWWPKTFKYKHKIWYTSYCARTYKSRSPIIAQLRVHTYIVKQRARIAYWILCREKNHSVLCLLHTVRPAVLQYYSGPRPCICRYFVSNIRV